MLARAVAGEAGVPFFYCSGLKHCSHPHHSLYSASLSLLFISIFIPNVCSCYDVNTNVKPLLKYDYFETTIREIYRGRRQYSCLTANCYRDVSARSLSLHRTINRVVTVFMILPHLHYWSCNFIAKAHKLIEDYSANLILWMASYYDQTFSICK